MPYASRLWYRKDFPEELSRPSQDILSGPEKIVSRTTLSPLTAFHLNMPWRALPLSGQRRNAQQMPSSACVIPGSSNRRARKVPRLCNKTNSRQHRFENSQSTRLNRSWFRAGRAHPATETLPAPARTNAALARACLQPTNGLTFESACRQALARSCALSSASRCRTALVSGFPARPHGFRTSPFTGPDRILASDIAQRFPILEAWPEVRRRSHGRDAANAAAEERAGRCDELVLVTASSVVATASLPNHTAAGFRRLCAVMVSPILPPISPSRLPHFFQCPAQLRDAPGQGSGVEKAEVAMQRSPTLPQGPFRNHPIFSGPGSLATRF